LIHELFRKRLLVVTGKGGVGKTSIASALALKSARDGVRTLVCEVNARERISQLLGHLEVGAEVTELEQNLWAVNVQPREALREYALMLLKFEALYGAVFENRLVRYFLRFIPSLQELVLLGKILFHVREKRADGSWRFERIVIDAPSTGHAITFLSVPQVLLDTVPPGAMANEATWMRDLLIDEDITALVLVSLPEELPVTETLELHEAMVQRVKIRPQAVVLNGATARRFDAADLEALGHTGLKALAVSHDWRARQSSQARDRLAALRLPIVIVPRIFSTTFDRSAIESVSRSFAAGGDAA
jgi:anion-transporting  ArsA/GET3 family ATPase